MNLVINEFNQTPSESVVRILEALNLGKPKQLLYGKCVDKFTQYQFFKEKELPHPEWTDDYHVAEEWQSAGHTVVCREQVKGAKGSGVFICAPGDDLVDAKIYVKYQKKKREFRVNIFKNKFVNIREKKRKAGATGDTKVWSPHNGYITAHVQTPVKDLQLVKDLAEKASLVSESDFVGVDIIYNQFFDKYYVLEVNSGPAIEGSSVDDFAAAIEEWYEGNN